MAESDVGSGVRLLREWYALEYTPELVRESREKNDGKVMLKGVIQKADTLNQNGRIYPRPILEREVRNFQKFIQEKRALGELDHPDTSVVNLKNVSHIMREVWMDGDTVYGTLELLQTPSGKILQSLVESGVTLGISSRGVGSTRKHGDAQEVQDDFQIITWDVVNDPSTANAFLMKEGRQVTQDELRKTFTRSDRISRMVRDVLDMGTGE